MSVNVSTGIREDKIHNTDKESRREIEDKAQSRRETAIVVVLIAMLFVAVLISLGVGHYRIPVSQVIFTIKSWIIGKADIANNPEAVVVLLVRVPRILLCMMVGAALAASGAAYQGLFRNPLVSPDILGVSAGAGVGASIAILMGASTITLYLMAFSFGIGAVFLVIALASLIGKGNPATLILVLSGMVISSLFASCTALLKYLADSLNKLPDVVFWLMGSFAKGGSYQNVLILFIAVLIGGLPLFLIRWQMNVLAFGDEEAQAMGINVRRLRFAIIIFSTLLTASSVAISGIIAWVGLVIPHITRFLVGPNFKMLLPTSMVIGALFMVIVDDFARTLISGEIPIGVITSLVGAPIFIYMLFKGKKAWV